ncbi:MAG: EndoU domain-containing protein [bacterium]|nr:EndoU domain-containing protein [bacterium]
MKNRNQKIRTLLTLLVLSPFLWLMGQTSVQFAHVERYLQETEIIVDETLSSGGLCPGSILMPLANDLKGPNADDLKGFFDGTVEKFRAWEVLYSISDDIGILWKTDIPTLTKLSDDIALNSSLEGWLKNNPGYFDVWNSVKHVPPASRADISFLQAFKNIVDDLSLQKHIDGEFKVETKSYGYKIRVSGYHKNLDEIDLPTPLHGNAGVPNPNNPNDITIVSIGTPTNPATKGRIRTSNRLNEQGSHLPYTAQVDAEIPPNSGYFFPKTGTDGINPGSGRSSIFPDDWTDSQILEEIAYVRRNMTASDLSA